MVKPLLPRDLPTSWPLAGRPGERADGPAGADGGLDRETVESMRAYHELLLRDGERGEAAVARELGLSPAAAAAVREALIRLGLLVPAPHAPGGWSALSPDAAARRRIQELDDHTRALVAELDQARETVGILTAFTPGPPPGEVEELTGLPTILAALDDAATSARKDIAAIHPGLAPSGDVMRADLDRIEAASIRGPRVRAVYQTATLRLSHTRSYLKDFVALGGQVRTAHLLPLRLVLVDESFAFTFAPTPSRQHRALVVRNEQLVTVFRNLFEHIWATADPMPSAPDLLPADGPAKPTGQRLEILRLLAAGMTDEAIARKIGVSTRTIRRQTSEIAARLDAGSRFRAGVLAARLGWLD